MSQASVVREVWALLRVRKKWWLAPILLLLVLVGALLVFAQTSALAPFIYTIFYARGSAGRARTPPARAVDPASGVRPRRLPAPSRGRGRRRRPLPYPR